MHPIGHGLNLIRIFRKLQSGNLSMLLGNRDLKGYDAKDERPMEINYDIDLNYITGSEKIFDDPIMDERFTHEWAHGYQIQKLGDSQKLNEIYERLMRARGFEPYPKKKITGKFQMPHLDSLLESRMESDAVISIFDESSYGKSSSSKHGHPYEDSRELFASTSAKLKNSPEKVFEKIDGLKTSAEKKIALETARDIVSLWVDRFFPDEVYRRLGIK